MADYFQYKYTGSNIITVQEFVDDPTTPITVSIDAEEFIIYEGVEGTQNFDLITDKYSKIQKNTYSNEISSLSADLPILPGTSIRIPKDYTDIEVMSMYSEGQFLKQGNFEAYLGDYEDLLLNKNLDYRRSNETTINSLGVVDIRMLSENIQVWIWIRAIDRIVDVTPFVNYINTSKQSDIGSFSFSLNPVVNIEDILSVAGGEYVNFFPINAKKGHLLDFFEKNLQQNDVVFIRFEQLNRDKTFDSPLEKLTSLYRETYHLKSILAKERTWDMIGLIDTARVSYSANNTDKTINVNGRDLMKLLVDDGSYFLPYKYIEGKDTANKLVWGGDETDNWFKRNLVSGNFESFFSYEMKSIGQSLKFIINHLSNLGVTPDTLWEAYGEDRTVVYDNVDDNKEELAKLNVNGIWQIIKLAIDDNIDNDSPNSRVIAGDGLMNPDGTLYEFFNNICQKPFVEFWGDTYTDTFDFIVRQPPFTKAAIQGVLKNNLFIEIEEQDLISYDFHFDTTFYSHYQIEPQGQWVGTDLGTFQAIVPIIYMPQYADTFGNKRLYVKDNYLSRISIFGEGKESKFNTFVESILNDYRLIIESNAYLPFTRKGTITLNGDRRIKKGGFILHKATNELFYVDGVSNNFSASTRNIDRTTTVTVSRGMKTESIDARFVVSNLLTPSIPSYFDIVDAELITKTILDNLPSEDGTSTQKQKSNVSTNFGVNEEAFNYFLNREHFV